MSFAGNRTGKVDQERTNAGNVTAVTLYIRPTSGIYFLTLIFSFQKQVWTTHATTVVVCRLATLVVTLANKEPTQGMLLSDINGTVDITMAAEVGSTYSTCKCNESKIKISV